MIMIITVMIVILFKVKMQASKISSTNLGKTLMFIAALFKIKSVKH